MDNTVRRVEQLFFEQANRTPDAIALEFEGHTITYSDLAERVLRAASLLSNRSIQRGAIVGVMVERSPDMVISLLSVLTVGAAYLPLDSAYPIERLRYMVRQGDVGWIITSRDHVNLAKELAAECLLVEDIRCSSSSHVVDRSFSSLFSNRDLIYLLYTSGSTGAPKGVLVEHAGVVNRLLWMVDKFEVTHEDRFLQKTPLGFDVSVWELFVPLVTGARLVLAAPGRHADAHYLWALIHSSRISFAQFVPSMLRQFLSSCPDGLQSEWLRHVICSGEELTPALVERFYSCSSAQLHNNYGPTEASIEVTHWHCECEGKYERIPIGFPLPNVSIEVLSDNGEAVDHGEIGELYLGGICVARGYVKDEPQTLAAFPMIKTHSGDVQRMYRTGDLVRLNAGGALEFVGRKDTQVKIRGYRVELGEVERLIEKHPSVMGAVAVWTEESLRCFVSARSGASIVIRALREHCEQYLPPYMWPSEIFVVDSFKLTSSGKIDRKAFLTTLASVDLAVSEGEVETDDPPQTQLEREIAEVWTELTGVESIGRRESYFWIGGNSISLIQMISELCWRFDVELDLSAMRELLTISGLAKQIEYKRAIKQENSQLLSLVSTTRSARIPLSVTQERIWILDRLGAAGAAFIMPAVFRIKGSIDQDVLEIVIRELVRRHETLRTRIVLVGERPEQVVESADGFSIRRLNYSMLNFSGRDAILQKEIERESSSTIDLEKGPLFRATLIKMSETDTVLALTFHHIIADGWSLFSIIPREIGALYTAFVQGLPSPLKALPVQYADYAQWQRLTLASRATQIELEYWKTKLDGVSMVLEIPTSRTRPAISTYAGRSIRLNLPAECSCAVYECARSEHVTIFMFLMAAFQLVLSRWSGQTSFLVGSTSAGRTNREIEGLIGCFVNTMLLHADLKGDPTFSQLLARVRLETVDAFAHQYVPIESLIDELQPDRDLSRQPLFQFALSLHNTPPAKFNIDDAEILFVPVEGKSAKIDLAVHIFETGTGLQGYCEYATDIFDAETIERFLAHFSTALQEAAAAPSARLSSLSILPMDERKLVLVGASPSVPAIAPVSAPSPLLSLIDANVRAAPHSVAVSDAHLSLTYHELDTYSSRVAFHLIAKLGDGPGRLMLLFDPEVLMIVAILGALKAGKTYVPMDPTMPLERRRSVHEAVEAKGLLCSSSNIGSALDTCTQESVFCLESMLTSIEVTNNFKRSGAALTYILFTSGSTGVPKGVYQCDENVARIAQTYSRSVSMSSNDQVTLIPSYAFDAAVMDIFAALVVGASLHILDIKSRGYEDLSRWIQARGITVWHSTPTVFRFACRQFDDNTNSTVKCVVLGGETATYEDAVLARRKFGSKCLLVNGYGPTETTLGTQYFASFTGEARTGPLPIGKPIEGISVFLCDYDGRATELRGELCISSPHAALGYWHDDELTAKKFVTTPSGIRFYRSGDLGWRLPDGSFIHLGRLDLQVKIRGNRVELQDVEEQIGMHPSTKRVAAAVTTSTGVAQLVVGVVLRDGVSNAEGLHAFARSRLPSYMVPSRIVVVDELPLLPNGKVDRVTLSEMCEAKQPKRSMSKIEPRTQVEKQLLGLWQDLFKHSEIGMEDDFFELGGDSLRAIWVIHNIEQTFGKALSLTDLFKSPTIEALAQRLDT